MVVVAYRQCGITLDCEYRVTKSDYLGTVGKRPIIMQ